MHGNNMSMGKKCILLIVGNKIVSVFVLTLMRGNARPFQGKSLLNKVSNSASRSNGL
jgi:hypothetical protein